RLAGLRINPRTNGPHRPPRYSTLTLLPLADGREHRLALPPGANPGFPLWSPDGRHLAFTNTTAKGIELWVADVPSGEVRRIPGVVVNAVPGPPVHWLADSRTLLCQTLPGGRGKPPPAPRVPNGPVIQQSDGKAAPVRTYQDLLRDKHDEDLFDYYAAAQLVL